MNLRLLVGVVLVAAPAVADRAVRKPPSPSLAADAADDALLAYAADRNDNLWEAADRYKSAIRRAPTDARLHYNLADVLRRSDYRADAADAYRQYLRLAPTASDRAAVERLVAELSAPRTEMTLGAKDLFPAVIVLDGNVLGPSPQTTKMPTSGLHLVERISSEGYRQVWFNPARDSPPDADDLALERDTRRGCSGDMQCADTGNVVITPSRMDVNSAWKLSDPAFPTGTATLPMRISLRPGRYQPTLNKGLVFPRACAPLTFEVPRKPGITYVYLDISPEENSAECVQVKLRQQQIVLPP